MPTKRQELVVEITTQADKAKRDLEALTKAAKPLEAGVDVPVKVTGADKAADQLEKATRSGRDLGKALEDVGTVDVKADTSQLEAGARRSSAEMDTLRRSTDGSKNALANLVGNTTQDLGDLGGSLGSVGVALGQVAEYTADAANESGNLGAALSGAARVAVPLAGLAAAGLAVTTIIGDMQARTAELAKIQEDTTAALVEGVGALEDYGTAVDEAFGQGTASTVEAFGRLIGKGIGEDNLQRATLALSTLGRTVEDFGPTMIEADRNFTSFATGILKARGASDETAGKLAQLINSANSTKAILSRAFEYDIDTAGLEDTISALEELNDQAENVDLEAVARDFLRMSAAAGTDRDLVTAAIAETDNMVDASQRYIDKVQERRRIEAAAALELEQATNSGQRQLDELAEAEQAVADAATEAKRAQDDWLFRTVDYEAGIDEVTTSIRAMVDQTKEQAKAGEEGAASFEGNTAAAIENRDAFRDIIHESVDVVDSFKQAGMSADEARTAQLNLAESAYQTAIAMGAPEEVAVRLRDTIAAIKPTVTTEVKVTEQGLTDIENRVSQLVEPQYVDLYYVGHVDRELQDFIRNSGFGAAGASVQSAPAPASAAVAPMAARAVPLSAAAPSMGRSSRASHAVTVPVEVRPVVNVTVSAGVVADTFQLQRVVERAVRGGTRLGGRR